LIAPCSGPDRFGRDESRPYSYLFSFSKEKAGMRSLRKGVPHSTILTPGRSRAAAKSRSKISFDSTVTGRVRQ